MDKPTIFGDCRLHADGLLATPEGDRQLTTRNSGILRMLVEARGVAISSDALLDAFWGVGEGGPQNLIKSIFQLRQALAASPGLQIESVYGYGYRLRVLTLDQRQPDPAKVADTICEEAAHRMIDRREISLRSALAMYEEAARIDQSCLRAVLGYADVRHQLMYSAWEPMSLGWPSIQSAVREALQLAPHCAEALAYRGLGEAMYEWNFAASEATFDAAIGLSPTSFAVLNLAALAALFRGRGHLAIDHFRSALVANPMAMSARGLLAYALTSIGEIEAAKAEIQQIEALDPSTPALFTYRGWMESTYGDPTEGVRLTGELLRRIPTSSLAVALNAFSFARNGQAAAGRAQLRTLGDRSRFAAPHSAICGMAWLALGEPDTAIESLEAAADARDSWLGPMLAHPINEPLHEQPGFQALKNTVFETGSDGQVSLRRSV